jgi:acetyl esterase/lipase
MLKNSVFIPSSYKPGTKLPFLIDIHGVGFALMSPQIDDEFCHQFANRFGFCVVVINYRKGPLYPFPEPIYNAEVIAKANLTVFGKGSK